MSGKFIDEFKMACSPEAKSALKYTMGHVHSFVTAACKCARTRMRLAPAAGCCLLLPATLPMRFLAARALHCLPPLRSPEFKP